MTTAETIIEQLGGNIFMRMTGAKRFVNHDDGLSLRVSGLVTHNKINYVKITLNTVNLYNVEFGRVHAPQYTIKRIDKNVDPYMLQSIFTEATGLDTKLTGVPR